MEYIPPDTNGAVGATQYVQWVNTYFAVFDKTNGALVAGPTAGNTLWTGFGGGCETNNDGDPIVLYDKLANRWVMSQFSVSDQPVPGVRRRFHHRRTPPARGIAMRFEYSDFDDYPKMGVWPDAYYETFNMFDGNDFVGSDACAYDRSGNADRPGRDADLLPAGPVVGGLLPADVDGTTPRPPARPTTC